MEEGKLFAVFHEESPGVDSSLRYHSMGIIIGKVFYFCFISGGMS
jgi:hypothetical protein